MKPEFKLPIPWGVELTRPKSQMFRIESSRAVIKNTGVPTLYASKFETKPQIKGKIKGKWWLRKKG